MSSNATSVMTAAHLDAQRFFGAGRVDLKNIGEAEARKLMSAEHKALGYRPPPGSLAATAQAEAAKHPEANLGLPEEALTQAAMEDAMRIEEQRTAGLDLDYVGEADARKLMSEEHKALGFRPPPGSLASQAQAAAAKHPDANAPVDTQELQRAALEDAAQIANIKNEVDLNSVGEAEARKLFSEEHKALGYRPPRGSLASEAQAAAAKHPDSSAGVDVATLTKAAVDDARAVETRRQAESSPVSVPVNLETITQEEAHALQSEVHKTLGFRPPPGSVAAMAQSVVNQRAKEPVTKELAATIELEEHKALGHLPESGSIAATAQSLADKNENDGGERKLGDVGL